MPINVSKTLRKANGLARKGDVESAAALFRTVLQQYPQNRQAARGLASLTQARTPVTGASQQAFHSDMQRLVGLFNQGRIPQALELGQQLAQQYPGEPLVHNVLGSVNKSLRNYDSAIASFNKAIQLQPDYAEAYSNLGAAFHDIGMYEEAIANYTNATRYNPDFCEAYGNLGNVLVEAGRGEQAIESYRQALRIRPDSAAVRASLMFQLAQVCDWATLRTYAAHLSELGIAGEQVHPFALLALEDEPHRHFSRSSLYAARTFQPPELPPAVRPDVKPDRLKIGYFSADFHDHATMYLMARLFELHDRDRFSVHVYSYGVDTDDAMRTRLTNAVDHFHEVRSLGDREIAELSRSHGIDIAVDLKGYTQHSRLGIFSHRPAPVQISYLGYPGTTGAPFIDYVIADKVVIPKGQTDSYSEKVIYLPHSYQVNDDTRGVSEHTMSRAEAGLPEVGFVFCCFNNNFKIGQSEFDIWMRLLQRVSGSVLWLFSSSATAQDNLRSEAQQRGVRPDRIIFAEKCGHSEHLARHRLADLFLDTFHYNAHTTASDALWAGLPLITRPGRGFAARVAASLLHAVDVPELITSTESEYERLALELALDPERLAATRSRLSSNRLSAPLFDSALFARHIEDGYQKVYQKYFDGDEPGTIGIEP